MLDLAPRGCRAPSRSDAPQVFPAEGARRLRVALLTGCAQRVLDPGINDGDDPALDPARLRGGRRARRRAAAARSCTTWAARTSAHDFAARNIGAWWPASGGLDAVVINTSGCGTTVKDYGLMFRNDPLAGDAATVAPLARDVTELLAGLRPPRTAARRRAAGSRLPLRMLAAARPEGSGAAEGAAGGPGSRWSTSRQPLCCGSAGTYNLMQPDLGRQLGAARWRPGAMAPQVIAAGNIGCMMQIARHPRCPCAHGRAARLGDRRACPGHWLRSQRDSTVGSERPRAFARLERPCGRSSQSATCASVRRGWQHCRRPAQGFPKCRLDTGESRFLIA